MAKSLQYLTEQVFDVTKRAALVTETMKQVQQATLKAHHQDFWARDIVEIAFQFASPAYIYSLDYKALIPLFRDIKYLRKLDYTATPPVNFGKPIDVIDPTNALDSYNQTKQNVCYLAGVNLQIYLDTPWQYFTMGAAIHPDVSEANYSSWIAEDYEYAIVDEAARRIFMIIGKDEEAARYKEICDGNKRMLTTSCAVFGGSM